MRPPSIGAPSCCTSGAQLNRLIDELDATVATEPGPTTVSALIDATHGLQQTAPELFDSLHKAVQPMQTLVEQRSQLTDLINGGMHTMDTSHTALNNHADRLVKITGELTPVIGNLADTSHHWVPAFVKLNQLSDKFFREAWMPEQDIGNMRVNLSFTPSYTYTRADCPQYAGLKGPSCFTAPLVPTRPSLPDVLLPQNYQPPEDLMPPAGDVRRDERQPRRRRTAADQPEPQPGRPESATAVVDDALPPVPGTANLRAERLLRLRRSRSHRPAPVAPRARRSASARRGRARLLRRKRRPSRQ